MEVCHNRRILRHKVFKDMAERGKSTMGWFYGFKLHIVINNNGGLMGIKVTGGNKDDRSVMEEITDKLKGKLFADKRYISKSKFKALWNRGLQLITGIKSNMKNQLMPLIDKVMLRGKFIVESVFNILKNNMNLEYTRHRSHLSFCIIYWPALLHILLENTNFLGNLYLLSLIHNWRYITCRDLI